ncbi:MAG: acetate--CoA ligase family protein [Actinomycetia bacterium]|nr:acetate--CoA ligase family protein [Actinomycetes bacterium]
MPNTRSDLGPLFAPASVAIIGASEREGNRGGAAAGYLRRFGFPGNVYPVHPSAESVAGYRAVPKISDLPETPDVAIIAVGGASTPALVRELGRVGVGAAIVWAGGFAETGAQGAALQAELVDAARRHGVRLLGPNCLGVINTGSAFTGTFATWLRKADRLIPGHISMASQSGGLSAQAHSSAQANGIGFRFVVSTGNEAGISAIDAMEYFVDDPETRVIATYLEGGRDGRRLAAVLRRAREAAKPVVVIKGGRSAASAAAIAAHTGAMAGQARVWDSILDAEGAIQVASIEEMVEVASFVQSRRGRLPVPGRRVIVLGFGGGSGVLAADQCTRLGLEIRSLSQAVRERLIPLVPEIASINNPLDLTPEFFAQPRWRGNLPAVLRVLDESNEADVILAQIGLGNMTAHADAIVGPICDHHDHAQTALAIHTRASDPRDLLPYMANGVHIFSEQSRATATLGLLARLAPANEGQSRHVLDGVATGAFNPSALRLPDASSNAVFPEHIVHQLLDGAGLPGIRSVAASSAADAVAAADDIGYPVAMKVLSAKITHRASAGLVRLSVPDPDSVRRTYDELAAASLASGAVPDAIMVQQMAPRGTELLMSGFRDPTFGPIVSAGAGGVETELIDDVAFDLAPLTPVRALALLRRLRISDHPKRFDLDLVGGPAVSYLVEFSRLVAALPWSSFVLELNPVNISSGSAVALDGLLVVSDAAPVATSQ